MQRQLNRRAKAGAAPSTQAPLLARNAKLVAPLRRSVAAHSAHNDSVNTPGAPAPGLKGVRDAEELLKSGMHAHHTAVELSLAEHKRAVQALSDTMLHYDGWQEHHQAVEHGVAEHHRAVEALRVRAGTLIRQGGCLWRCSYLNYSHARTDLGT
jgi:hypothetical protein